MADIQEHTDTRPSLTEDIATESTHLDNSNKHGASVEQCAAQVETTVPREQQAYLHYKENRLLRLARINVLLEMTGSDHAAELGRKMVEYKRLYKTDPITDRFYVIPEAENRDEFFQHIELGNGEIILLPITIDGRSVGISVLRIDADKHSNQERLPDYDKDKLVVIQNEMRTMGITHRFSINIGYLDRLDGDQRMDVIGKSDFYTMDVPYHQNDQFLSSTTFGGMPQDVISAQFSDRERLNSLANENRRYSFVTDPHVKLHGKHGLGAAMFSLGRHLAQQVGSTRRVVEQDKSKRDDVSFYVKVLGGEETKSPYPYRQQDGTFPYYYSRPTFDTAETTQQPYKYGPWFPVK